MSSNTVLSSDKEKSVTIADVSGCAARHHHLGGQAAGNRLEARDWGGPLLAVSNRTRLGGSTGRSAGQRLIKLP
jgi:hypothetical protein